jgi:hypothetical protein
MRQMEIGDIVEHDIALPTDAGRLWPVVATRPVPDEWWLYAKPEVVLLAGLTATQQQLDPALMHPSLELPRVLAVLGQERIIAGHEQLAIHKLRGQLAAEVLLLTVA